MLCATIPIDFWLLQNFWQPNFIQFMLKSGSQKVSKGRSWTFYLQLRNPGYDHVM